MGQPERDARSSARISGRAGAKSTRIADRQAATDVANQAHNQAVKDYKNQLALLGSALQTALNIQAFHDERLRSDAADANKQASDAELAKPLDMSPVVDLRAQIKGDRYQKIAALSSTLTAAERRAEIDKLNAAAKAEFAHWRTATIIMVKNKAKAAAKKAGDAAWYDTMNDPLSLSQAADDAGAVDQARAALDSFSSTPAP